MRKITTVLLSMIVFLSTLFCVSCTVKYKLIVDISKAQGVNFLQELDESYHPGTSLTVKTPIYTDIDLWAYLDGEPLGKQRPVKTGDEYSHWEFYFTMPERDAVLSFEWKANDGTHTCYPVCLDGEEPTCQQEGLSIIACGVCGYIYEQTVLPKVDCEYGVDWKCVWCGKQPATAAECLPWIKALNSQEIICIEREERGYGIKPGNFTTVFISEEQADKQSIMQYLQTVRLIKVPKEYGQVDGGGGTHLTITTLTAEYSFVVANGYVCINGEYYQPTENIPIINMEKTAHRFIVYSNTMRLYKDGVYVKEYENLLGKVLFEKVEQIEDKTECEYVLSVDGFEVRIYNGRQFSYKDNTYQIIGDIEFLGVVK